MDPRRSFSLYFSTAVAIVALVIAGIAASVSNRSSTVAAGAEVTTVEVTLTSSPSRPPTSPFLRDGALRRDQHRHPGAQLRGKGEGRHAQPQGGREPDPRARPRRGPLRHRLRRSRPRGLRHAWHGDGGRGRHRRRRGVASHLHVVAGDGRHDGRGRQHVPAGQRIGRAEGRPQGSGQGDRRPGAHRAGRRHQAVPPRRGSVVDWEVEPGKLVKAWAYNGVVPGPTIRVEEGDKVQIVLENQLPESTSLHPHGCQVPDSMDGFDPITQPPSRQAPPSPTSGWPPDPRCACTTPTTTPKCRCPTGCWVRSTSVTSRFFRPGPVSTRRSRWSSTTPARSACH